MVASAKRWALCHELRMNTARNTAFNSCLDQWGIPWWSLWVECVLGSHLVQLVVEIKDAFYIIRIISIQLMSQFSSILTTFLCIFLYFLPSHSILASLPSLRYFCFCRLWQWLGPSKRSQQYPNIQFQAISAPNTFTWHFWDLEMQFIYNFIFIGIQLIYSTVLIWGYITKWINFTYTCIYSLF